MPRLNSYQRGYNAMWRKARLKFLQVNQLCEYCEARDIITIATVVDHRIPHRGDRELFWDESNWVACCETCHNSYKQRIEKGGVDTACDTRGMPQDQGHHWNKK